MRITMTAPRGQLDMTVEVMSILPGVDLVDFDKVTGDSVDFYNSYAKITEHVQPLITADALRRADSGQQIRSAAVIMHRVTPHGVSDDAGSRATSSSCADHLFIEAVHSMDESRH